MDMKVAEYVIAIAQYGNISKAAEKLYISQSGLNQQLIKLEATLGVKLFDRDNRHLQITQAGKIFVTNAMEMLRIQRNLTTQLSDLKQDINGEISLGLTHEHGIDLFTAIYFDFHTKYPQIKFNLMEKIVADQYRLLNDGTLDMGVVMLKTLPQDLQNHFVIEPLYKEDFLLGIPKAHPLAKKAVPIGSGKALRAIDLRLFKDELFSLIFESSTMRQEVLDPLFERCGFHPYIMMETAMNHALAQMVGEGLCCTILPHSRVAASKDRDRVAWFRILENPTWSIAMIRRKDYRMSHSVQYLLSLSKQYGKAVERQFLTESPGYNKEQNQE